MAEGERFSKSHPHPIFVLDGNAPDAADALKASIASIVGDATLSKTERAAMLDETTAQYLEYLGVPFEDATAEKVNWPWSATRRRTPEELRARQEQRARRAKEKETEMLTTDQLRKLDVPRLERALEDIEKAELMDEITKTHGMRAVARQELDLGKSAFSEIEASRLWTEYALQDPRYRKKGESESQAFAKLIADDPLAMQHIDFCKREGWRDPQLTSSPRFTAQPRQVGGNAAFDNVNEATSAMAVYEELVAEIRAAHPTLTATQVYSRAYADRRHADALAAERGQSRPGGSNIRERVTSPSAAPTASSPGRL